MVRWCHPCTRRKFQQLAQRKWWWLNPYKVGGYTLCRPDICQHKEKDVWIVEHPFLPILFFITVLMIFILIKVLIILFRLLSFLGEDVADDFCADSPSPSKTTTCEVSCGMDCVVTEWSQWSPCSQSCSNKNSEGRQTRTRSVLALPGEGKQWVFLNLFVCFQIEFLSNTKAGIVLGNLCLSEDTGYAKVSFQWFPNM